MTRDRTFLMSPLTLSVTPPSKRRYPPRRRDILRMLEKVPVRDLSIFVQELRRYSHIQSGVYFWVPVYATKGILAEVSRRHERVPRVLGRVCVWDDVRWAQLLPHLCLCVRVREKESE